MAFKLSLLYPAFAICRLDPLDAIPVWALTGSFFTITRTDEELSIVCEEAVIDPEHGMTHIKIEPGWRCLKLQGPIPFQTTGVIASLTTALANAGISVSPIATYDTDYLFVKNERVQDAIRALKNAGHEVSG
ncbi:MAG: hypothetical protein JWO20_552 [Candidatus Angelobacter sp.]|jgi:hypothetical protein|nr:hypothetical protein [Candidatus Angelobacter sp.]